MRLLGGFLICNGILDYLGDLLIILLEYYSMNYNLPLVVYGSTFKKFFFADVLIFLFFGRSLKLGVVGDANLIYSLSNEF